MGERPSASSVESVLSRVRSLSSRAARDRTRSFWIEGVRNFVQACDARCRIDEVIYSPVLLKSVVADVLVRRLKSSGLRPTRLTPEQFRAISGAGRASGVGAIVRQQWISLEQAELRDGLCWIVVEQIRSPGNLGTIVRTAEAVGAAGLIFVGRETDPFDPAVVRASMGGLFHLPLIRANSQQIAAWAKHQAIELVGLAPQAERLWTDLPEEGRLAIVLGEERAGLSGSLQSLCTTTVRLPMSGRADSLNVGIAAGVMMYELVRRAQRRSPSHPARG